MIRDLDEHRGELPAYDLCIVGSGPAGTTLAAELVGSGLRVAVLESGRLEVSDHGDRLREVESEGIHVKEYSRERVLGGTSTTWAGLAAPLDTIDFERRPWLAHSSWPIPRAELVPYWEEAAERYRFPAATFFDPGGEFGELRRRGEFRPRWEGLEEKIFLAATPPQNFGREWRHVFEGEDVDAWLDATVVELVPDAGGERIEAARVRTRSARELLVRSKVFVLATGGLENARLLLNSTALSPAGLGNEHDQVGRYLMNHPKNYHGIVRLAGPRGDLPFYYGCLFQGFAGYAGLRLDEVTQREKELLNSYVRFEPLFPWTDSEGVEALVLLVKRSAFLMRRWTRGRKDEVVALRDYSETGDDSDLQNARKSWGEWLALLFAIPRDLPRVLHYLKYRLLSRRKPPLERVRLRNFMEMEPSPENRVIVSEERDALGARRAVVRHDTTTLDRRSLVELHAVLARELEAQGFGHLETSLEAALAEGARWPIDQEASHHLGTTRMGEDPETSVVDPHQRVHSVHNLFVAGGSVFPTSGCANPTYTIVALSIRLARHLREEVFAADWSTR